ncbi:MAG: TraC family protein [Patescibacteria group bacterium]
MQSSKLTKSKPGVPAQSYLNIAEVREDVVVLKDGTLRAVLLVSSINFSLKSEDEQNAIVQAYMQFLNSLDFPIQVVIQSRRMNIDDYMNKLKEAEMVQKNELLRNQIVDYRSYVRQLVDLAEIMQKRFYLVVPLDPTYEGKKGIMDRLSSILTPLVTIRLTEERFKTHKSALMLRVNNVIAGLQGMSLNSVMLDTQSLIELYYTVYNPELFETQRMSDVNKLQIEG